MVHSNEPFEVAGGDDWAGLTSLCSLVRRYPVRIFLVTALATAAGFAISKARQPSFESSVYVGLDDWQSRNPVLKGLEIPTSNGDTKHAFSILRSQEVLELVVSGKEKGPEDFRMGLTTWVEEQPTTLTQSHPRTGHSTSIRARLDAPTGTEWVLYFDDSNHVSVARASRARGPWLRSLGTGLANQVQRIELGDGPTHTVFGHGLTLDVQGDLTGRTFSLQTLSKDQAIERLRSRVSLHAPDERKQVLKASVRCSQAGQAQELASALSHAFLHHESHKLQEQARSVVEYIGSELVVRQSELAAVDSEIATLRESNPDLVGSQDTLERLILRQSTAQISLDEATQSEEYLAAILGKGSLESTSLITLRRVAKSDQVDRWLDRIDELQNLTLGVQTAESETTTKALADRLQALAFEEQTARRYAELFEKRLQDFLTGDQGNLEALLDDNGQDLVQIKPILELTVRPFRQAQSKLVATREVYTDLHPDVIAARAELELHETRLISALEAHGETLWENHARAKSAMQPIAARMASAPEEVREHWAEGQAALWSKVKDALHAQHEHARSQVELRRHEYGALTDRIQRLPMDRNQLEGPLVARKALADKVHQLIAKQADAEVALAGLHTAANVLEPASTPRLRQPHMGRLGALVGMLIGLLASLGWAQFAAQRKLQREARDEHLGARRALLKIPVLSRMIRACADDNFAVGHPMHPNTEGPAFDALRRLRVQLNRLARRNINTSLLGITSLVAELNEFGMEEEPSQCRLVKDPWEGSYPTHTSSMVTSTIGALGICHALASKRVLIVDANVFGDSLTTQLDLVANPGLAECLTSGDAWQSHVVSLESNELDVLPLGLNSGEDDELLEHPKWGVLLQELQHHYDVVLVELPGVHDAPRLAHLTRQLGSLMVVENARLRIDSEESSRLLGPLRRSGTRLAGTFVAIRGRQKSHKRAA
ncbi:MAG: cellulose synthase operon protein YhjQ/BcsQ [Planctomycetota bacterium]|nr:cellulose synthase operon protein YhjQ/BcsQ [Planctomycetota bacterium]